jgi:hypothetical protein
VEGAFTFANPFGAAVDVACPFHCLAPAM